VGLSPLFIGSKVKFTQINVTYKAANNVHNYSTRPNKNGPNIINIVVEKINGANKIFFRPSEKRQPVTITMLGSIQV
jgi:hypothetical protein